MIDLSQIPAPNVIEALDYETLLAERKAELLDALPEDQRPAIQTVLSLESEPLTKWLETSTYRELLLRQRVNDAARAVMLAQAVDTDLDQLGANWGVVRLVVTPADDSALPPVPAVMERDEDFRRRILLRLEAFSTAGSEAAYLYHGLSASGQVLDVSTDSPTPGYVVVYVLSRSGDGTAPTELVDAVRAALSAKTVRPLTDNVTVLSGMRIARGLVNELYLDDLRAKTHRGLQGQFERGFAAGGRTYGYASVQEEGGHRVVIDEEQAQHVRWIYEQVAAGATLRSIVYKLNERGVPSPRGNGWAASALVGNPKMGDGLLNNEIYIGRVVWNRRQWLKDPETGKRLAVARPPAEWMVREAPELRILDQALWDSTRPLALKRAPGRGRPHATLFGGLLRCATCDGAITAISSVRYGCSAHKDKGPTACPNSATWRREDVDHRLLAELREDLLSPAAMAEVQTTVRRLLAELDGGHERAQADARRRGAELDKEIKRIVDAIVAVGASEALATRLRAAELERKTLEATLQQPPQVTISADQIAAAYRRLVMNLRESLAGTVAEARPVVAGLLGEITLCRNEETGESWAQMKEPAEQLLIAAAGGSLKMVARGGFEPPTFGL